MSRISDLYYQIIFEKLNGTLKAISTKSELNKEMHLSSEEINRLLSELLKDEELNPEEDYIYKHEVYDDYNGEQCYLAINDKKGPICFHSLHGNLISEQDIKDVMGDVFLGDILKLNNIDIEKIKRHIQVQLDSKRSIDAYQEEATAAKENLIRAKLRQSIKDSMEGKQQSRDTSLFRDNQIYTLLDMLEKAGFQEGVDFWFEEEPVDYNTTSPELRIMVYDTLFGFSGMNAVTKTIGIQKIEEYAREYEDEIEDEDEYEYEDDDEDRGRNRYAEWLKLKPLNLEKLGIRIDTIERLEQTINNDESDKSIRDFLVDLKTYKVIKNKGSKIKADYVNTADLETVIYNLLRGVMIDTRANAMFNEGDNYCMIGEYSDMHGEEIIASVLNEVDRQILQIYFESYPADIYLFDDMSKKYSEIKPLDEEFSERIKSVFKKEFEESLFGKDLVESYFFENPDALEAGFGETVTRMEGFEQNNSHHMYDLWEHTLHTVESVDTEGLSPENSRILKIAAFFHDIGKPDASSFNEKTGQQVFYGHAHKSVDVAKSILERLGYSEQEIQRIGFFIGHHDDFTSYKSTLAPFMKNHEFIRGIDDSTIAEKIIENKYDFEAMGYNKDEIRTIVYTLAHGKEPDFRTKDGPISFPVDMEQVKKKMESGKYNAEYDATLEDYQMLLQLCRADARAQAEIVYDPKTGKETDSRKRKLDTFELIDNDMEAAFSKADTIINSISSRMTEEDKRTIEQYTGYSFEEFIQETKQLFKRPIMVMGDGTKMTVQASAFHYCEPRRSGLDSYKSYEVAYPSRIIDKLRDYAEMPVESEEELLESVYSNVPAELLSQIVMEHGGVNKEATLHPEKKLDGYKQEKAGMDDKTRKAQEMINQMIAQLGNIMEDYGKGNK